MCEQTEELQYCLCYTVVLQHTASNSYSQSIKAFAAFPSNSLPTELFIESWIASEVGIRSTTRACNITGTPERRSHVRSVGQSAELTCRALSGDEVSATAAEVGRLAHNAAFVEVIVGLDAVRDPEEASITAGLGRRALWRIQVVETILQSEIASGMGIPVSWSLEVDRIGAGVDLYGVSCGLYVRFRTLTVSCVGPAVTVTVDVLVMTVAGGVMYVTTVASLVNSAVAVKTAVCVCTAVMVVKTVIEVDK